MSQLTRSGVVGLVRPTNSVCVGANETVVVEHSNVEHRGVGAELPRAAWPLLVHGAEPRLAKPKRWPTFPDPCAVILRSDHCGESRDVSSEQTVDAKQRRRLDQERPNLVVRSLPWTDLSIFSRN